MAIVKKNEVEGKICSTCDNWKPLNDFPTDSTHGPSQGGRHCRCRECHRLKARKKTTVISSAGDARNSKTKKTTGNKNFEELHYKPSFRPARKLFCFL